MTEDEHIFLTDLVNRFWVEFSDLCNRYIKEATDRAPDLEVSATLMLGVTSIYGRRVSR